MQWIDPLLRPIARLAVQKGWLFAALADRLRHAYVAAAKDQAGPDTTDSRLSVMTGLQRRDIARLRNDDTAHPRSQRQPLAEIIARWWDDPAFPRARLPVHADGPCFFALAQSVRKDVHPRTFLDMLKQVGAVTETEGHVDLLTNAYVPLHGSDEQLAYLADNVGDHLKVAVGNVVDGDNAYDMAVHFQGLNADAIAQLEALWAKRMGETLAEVNKTARAFPTSYDGTHRFRAGAYFHKEPVE